MNNCEETSPFHLVRGHEYNVYLPDVLPPFGPDPFNRNGPHVRERMYAFQDEDIPEGAVEGQKLFTGWYIMSHNNRRNGVLVLIFKLNGPPAPGDMPDFQLAMFGRLPVNYREVTITAHHAQRISELYKYCDVTFTKEKQRNLAAVAAFGDMELAAGPRGEGNAHYNPTLKARMLPPDVAALMGSFVTGKEGTLSGQANQLKQKLGISLAPRPSGRLTANQIAHRNAVNAGPPALMGGRRRKSTRRAKSTRRKSTRRNTSRR